MGSMLSRNVQGLGLDLLCPRLKLDSLLTGRVASSTFECVCVCLSESCSVLPVYLLVVVLEMVSFLLLPAIPQTLAKPYRNLPLRLLSAEQRWRTARDSVSRQASARETQ